MLEDKKKKEVVLSVLFILISHILRVVVIYGLFKKIEKLSYSNTTRDEISMSAGLSNVLMIIEWFKTKLKGCQQAAGIVFLTF